MAGEEAEADSNPAPAAAAPHTSTGSKRSRDVVVEQWAVVDGSDDPFVAPELRPVCLTGTCYNHPNLPDGHMTSSNLYMLDEAEGVARSLNTQFQLGTPSAEFVEWMTKKGTKRPYTYHKDSIEQYSLELHREEDQSFEKRMKLSVPKQVELADMKEDREEQEEEAAGDGMDTAQRWLTKEDWDELHPGCPMSWMSEAQHERWMRDVLERKEQRKAEHRATRDED